MNQDKYQQMQLLEYQIKQLQKVMENIDIQLTEINNTKEALTEFEKLSNNAEILFPVANGVFAKGKISNNKLLSINIGSNVVVEKSVTETINLMDVQAKDIEKYKKEVMTQLQKHMDTINKLQETE